MIVFVHGVPETAAIWAKIRRAIGQDSIALSLPGFGCPSMANSPATKDDYVHWLVNELDRINGPIDLVGHDWGAGLTYRVASAYGERVHSWAVDVGAIAHPDYEWHELAKIFQTPGEGEAFFENRATLPPEQQASRFEAWGVAPADALEIVKGGDATMARCILGLYRSATPNVHRHWGPWTPTKAPGLVLHPADDPFDDARMAGEVSKAFGARFEPINGVGHFWPYQAPNQMAAILQSFWASLP